MVYGLVVVLVVVVVVVVVGLGSGAILAVDVLLAPLEAVTSLHHNGARL